MSTQSNRETKVQELIIELGKEFDYKYTDKERVFIINYAKTLNAAESARTAGYAPKNSRKTGSEMLKKPKMRALLDGLLEIIDDEGIADAIEVQKYLTSVMRGEITEETVAVEGCGEGYSSATTLDVKVAPKDRNKAAELLGKVHGLFTDKVEIDGGLDIAITVDYGDEDDGG